MGGNMSSYNPDALNWLEAHIGPWVADPAAIGLTSAQVSNLLGEITVARTAFVSVEAVRSTSKERTAAFKLAGDTMRKTAGPLISTIKAFAQTSTDPSAVYAAASITGKSAPSPVPAPSQPAGVGVTLGGDGSVTLSFEGTGATGTVWEVSRKLEGETSFTHLGHADNATKSFTDATVPGTVNSATYLVRGIRGSLAGPYSLPFGVQFGGADGAATEDNGAAQAA